jgi:acyl-CoA thioesterase I
MQKMRLSPGNAALLCPGWGRVLVAALAVSLPLLLSGCSKPAKLPPLAGDAVILAYGDSLTFGTGAAEDESYPSQLARITGRRVMHAGVPGEVSAAGLARLPAALDEHAPRLLLLCHGGNDFLRRLPRQAAADNVRAMIRLAKARGVEVLLIGTPEPSLTVAPPGFYAEIAAEFKIPYEGGVLSSILRDASLKADQVHPNAKGYGVMANAVAELLRKSGAL